MADIVGFPEPLGSEWNRTSKIRVERNVDIIGKGCGVQGPWDEWNAGEIARGGLTFEKIRRDLSRAFCVMTKSSSRPFGTAGTFLRPFPALRPLRRTPRWAKFGPPLRGEGGLWIIGSISARQIAESADRDRPVPLSGPVRVLTFAGSIRAQPLRHLLQLSGMR